MAGFVRRFGAFPGVEVLTEIEGVSIIDLPPPGSVSALGTGFACCVGEFPDMTYGVEVAGSDVTTKARVVELFSPKDLLDKVGGFDETVGDFGRSGGNGFVSLRNKKFSRLGAVPINLCSPKGIRVWRKLPMNTSLLNTEPVVPMQSGYVAAGREFRSGVNRARLGVPVFFKGTPAYLEALDAAVTALAAAATAGSMTGSVGPFEVHPTDTTIFIIDAGADQIWTWNGEGALCKMVAAGAYAGNVAGTFDVEWADASGNKSKTITVPAGIAAGELALLAALNTLLSEAGVPVVVEDSADANKLRFRTTRIGTSTHVAILAVTGAGFTAETGIAVTAQTTAPVVQIEKTPGSGIKTPTVAFLDAATAAEVDAAILLADDVTGASLTNAAGALTLTSSSTGLASSVQRKASSTAAVGFDSALHSGTAAGAGTAISHTLTSAGSDFVDKAVKEGDILVLDDGAGTNADTFRVKSITGPTQLVIERLDGSTWNVATAANLPFRIHEAACADTGLDHQLSETDGYRVPARPLDATIAASTVLTPTVAPPAVSADDWDTLSGLTARTVPVSGLVFDADVQAPNAVAHAKFDALYQLALDALLADDTPASEVNIVWTSRSSANIRVSGRDNVVESSAQGNGRVLPLSPPVDVVTFATVIGAASPGVGATRNERALYAWPGAKTFVPEAVPFRLRLADGAIQDGSADMPLGVLDTPCCDWLASVLSVLPPERNPGEASPFTKSVLSKVLGIQRGVTGLSINHYKQLRAKGVVGLRIDKKVGAVFQSGVTSSLTSGEKNINRRRMADFIQDSISDRLVQLSKQVASPQFKDAAVAEIDSFLSGLLSEGNPTAQRIAGYQIDDKTGNTPALEAKGVYVIIVRVRTLATADFIVLQTEIGEGVTITQLAA